PLRHPVGSHTIVQPIIQGFIRIVHGLCARPTIRSYYSDPGKRGAGPMNLRTDYGTVLQPAVYARINKARTHVICGSKQQNGRYWCGGVLGELIVDDACCSEESPQGIAW